ncbi:hypothetical protein B7P43_G03772 [Cryptotermes secundus]|uniref:Uncharacterized protein n=1 Tax=Cryptotermes secundus TaxID=105785 RepID=A0A2J7R1P6_9NEOP|nr:hypothetical protein B7P43_G03772 [Cryptotermes secundus]
MCVSVGLWRQGCGEHWEAYGWLHTGEDMYGGATKFNFSGDSAHKELQFLPAPHFF